MDSATIIFDHRFKYKQNIKVMKRQRWYVQGIDAYLGNIFTYFLIMC